MPHLPAAILILMDRPHPDKQMELALTVAAEVPVFTICYHWRDCLKLILSGHISAVICAVDPGGEARDRLDQAGAQLVVVREEPARIRRNLNRLIERLYSRGMDSQEIATILEVPAQDVRQSLDRTGIRRPRE